MKLFLHHLPSYTHQPASLYLPLPFLTTPPAQHTKGERGNVLCCFSRNALTQLSPFFTALPFFLFICHHSSHSCFILSLLILPFHFGIISASPSSISSILFNYFIFFFLYPFPYLFSRVAFMCTLVWLSLHESCLPNCTVWILVLPASWSVRLLSYLHTHTPYV